MIKDRPVDMLFAPVSSPNMTICVVQTGERPLAGEECRAATFARQSGVPEESLQGLLHLPCVQVHTHMPALYMPC